MDCFERKGIPWYGSFGKNVASTIRQSGEPLVLSGETKSPWDIFHRTVHLHAHLVRNDSLTTIATIRSRKPFRFRITSWAI